MDEIKNSNDFIDGYSYLFGKNNHPLNYKYAFERLTQASKDGEANADYYLGYMYENGMYCNPDFEIAIKYYMSAGEAGVSEAYNAIADIMIRKSVYEKAIQCYLKAVDAGNIRALYYLGTLYETHEEIKDVDKAEMYYKQAANAGDVDGMLALAKIHEIIFDYETAFKINEIAMDAGSPQAKFNYYNAYFNGWYVQEDDKKAYVGFKSLYVPDSKGDLGYIQGGICAVFGLYEEYGYIFPKNYDNAIKYYARGRKLGDGCCCNNLGAMYMHGRGVEKDEKLAFALYCEGAELGYPKAIANMGYCYENGIGVEKDIIRAIDYYIMARNMGNQWSKERLDEIKGNNA